MRSRATRPRRSLRGEWRLRWPAFPAPWVVDLANARPRRDKRGAEQGNGRPRGDVFSGELGAAALAGAAARHLSRADRAEGMAGGGEFLPVRDNRVLERRAGWIEQTRRR